MRRRSRKVNRKQLAIIILVAIVVFELIVIAILFKRPTVKKDTKAPPKGKIAIVLDDWGYNLKNINYLKNITYPLTLAILPNLMYSKEIAKKVKGKNTEVVLHLPLEPHPYESMGLELATIKTNMSKNKIRRLLAQSIKSVPCIKGVSNHMGSKATEDKELMRIIFHELKKRRLYFLDSVVTDKSICEKVAGEIRLKFIQRDVFLDNKQERRYIKHQLNELVEAAQRDGLAVGIGHDKKITLEVLEEEMPKIEKKGFVFVFLSDLVN